MKKIMMPLLLFGSAVIVFFSCRKTDYPPIEKSTINPVDKFFAIPSGTDPLAVAISRKMLKEEQQKPFVSEFVKAAGYPNWAKAVRSGHSKATARTSGDDFDEVLYLPFAKEEEAKTSAIVIATIAGRDTTLRTVYHYHYKSLPFESELWRLH